MKKSLFKYLIFGFLILYTIVILGWLLLDVFMVIGQIRHASIHMILLSPVFWHKTGELFVIIPLAVALAGLFFVWRQSRRLLFIKIATPFMIAGGLLNFWAAVSLLRLPLSQFSVYMIALCILFSIGGIGGPVMLRWVHRKRNLYEIKMEAGGDESS